ncbi:uncharacterized protein LOC105183782 isoform X2 [Harpegnathos saltator]|uniref:uncharacterized protein LOC105183782 isoform X2 n=1 Tax=Harpegnathos saltator TaxID=610380 RepID=UPI00058EC8A2|nr:uncharacterized protein LOC105183782 isoform X2 [Harpegnathos saltator]
MQTRTISLFVVVCVAVSANGYTLMKKRAIFGLVPEVPILGNLEEATKNLGESVKDTIVTDSKAVGDFTNMIGGATSMLQGKPEDIMGYMMNAVVRSVENNLKARYESLKSFVKSFVKSLSNIIFNLGQLDKDDAEENTPNVTLDNTNGSDSTKIED